MSATHASGKFLFVVGNSRSGTTVLGRALGSHSLVRTFPELQVFERLIEPEQMAVDCRPGPEALVEIGMRILATIRDGIFEEGPPERFEEEIRALIRAGKSSGGIETPMELYAALLRSETVALGKSIPCEQTPRYMFVAPEILEAFPQAHVVHIHRDPRDVLLSQKNRWRRRFLSDTSVPLKRTLVAWSNYHPEMTARLWGAVMRKADALSGHPRFAEISYEALLQDPAATMRSLCERIGLEFEPEMLQVPREGSSVNRDDSKAVGFDASRIGSWQNGGLSQAEIAICEARLGDAMAKRGYALSGRRASLPARAAIQATLPVKVLSGIFMNKSRFRNLRKTVLRRL